MKFLERFNYHKAHGHTYDNIESFDRVHDHHQHHHDHHSNDEKMFLWKEETLNHLRNELKDLAQHPEKYQNKICYRKCFKLETKGFIQDCLDFKCQGANFDTAAKELNLVK